MLIRLATLIVIGLIAGFLAAWVLGERRRYGLLGYLVLGAIGAIGGSYAFKSFGLPNVGFVPELIAALVGSLVVVLLLRLLRR